MSLGPALLVAALLAASTGPDLASEAFAHGDYARAEALALEQVQGPHPGAALYLAGLARFRRGEAAGALQLLDQSWSAPDRPDAGQWRFNRGSCLYELGRFAEAESEYLEAARLDVPLAAVSLIDAGFAALDADAPDRASALAERAGAIATPATQALLDDLRGQIAAAALARETEYYRAGLASFDAGEFAAAREKFLAAAALAPRDGRCRIMSGASALQLGARAEARADLELALSLELRPEEARIARDYLDELAAGMAARGTGWSASAQLAAGFDSNALQTGFLEPNEFPGANSTASPSAFATASLGLAFRARPSQRLFAELDYGFDQLVYAAPDASDRSLQQHALLGSLELSLRDDLRAGLSLGGQLSFTGLDQFRLLQINGLTALWAELDESERFTSRLAVGFEPKWAPAEFDYLGGDRFDAAITEELHAGRASATIGYRFRAELLGIAQQAVPLPPPPSPPPCMAGCTLTLIDPFGYTSNTLWMEGRASPWERWSFELSFGAELRSYTDDNALLVSNPDGTAQEVDRRRRQDTRWFADASASFALPAGVSLILRYDLVVNSSNIDSNQSDGAGMCGPPGYQCHSLDSEVRSYTKQVVSLGASVTW